MSGQDSATVLKQCRGCDVFFDPRRGALSRRDNRENVCSECGMFEAMAQFHGATLKDYGLRGWAIAQKEVQK